MGKNLLQKINEKLAPKLTQKFLETISRFLVFVGKPLFLLLITSLASLSLLLTITGLILKYLRTIFQKFSPQKIPSKGMVFSSKFLKIKILILKIKKSIQLAHFYFLRKTYRPLLKHLDEDIWKSQVFLLAVEKLALKFLVFLNSKFLQLKIKEKIKFLTLCLNLKLLQKSSFFSKLKFPKISKLKITAYFFGIVFLLLFVTLGLFWIYILKDLPDPLSLRERKVPLSTRIYDRNGILLYTIFKEQRRTPVSLDDLPPQVKLATIAIEDAEFYSHPGFSIKGIIRAIIKNLRQGELTGGSTITQQLVKNTLLTPEKTLIRKLKEIVLAIEVELNFSKDEILEMYLNEVSYGGTAYGIQEGARTYFKKDAQKLTLAEAALLAGLPKSPTKYSPFGTNPEISLQRQKEVLKRMQENGFITEEQRREAENETLKFAQNIISIKAPHFVFFVKEQLEEKYGKEVIEQGGLEIITTLDYRIQELAERVVKQEVEKLKNLNVTNGAALILNPKTGEIIAMVGSKDFFDTSIDGNVNLTIRPRQPGSSIKVVNYAYALSNQFTPATIISDTPVTFYVQGQPPYTPRNYEGGFRGNLTLRSAFAESRNIPAVRVLASYGVEKMLAMGQRLGISTWMDSKDYGLSLTLGGGEVKLIDLAKVYATIANYGRRPEIVSILKITDSKGRILEEFKCREPKNPLVAQINATASALEDFSSTSECNTQVLDPRVAFLITDILRDNNARAPAFGTNSLLLIPGHKEVAVKTGTSNELKDNLAIGYTQNYVVAAWVGNNDNSPMARIASGVTGATPIFNKIMSALLKESPSEDWLIPPGLVQLPICPYTGTLACEGCPLKMEWFLEENKPKISCKPEWFKKDKDLKTNNTQTDQASPGVNQEIKYQKPDFGTLYEEEINIDNKFFQKILR